MISIEGCKQILEDPEMSETSILELRTALYAMADSILDSYFEEFGNIDLCKKQLSTAELVHSNKALKDTDLRVKNIDVRNMLGERVIK